MVGIRLEGLGEGDIQGRVAPSQWDRRNQKDAMKPQIGL